MLNLNNSGKFEEPKLDQDEFHLVIADSERDHQDLNLGRYSLGWHTCAQSIFPNFAHLMYSST